MLRTDLWQYLELASFTTWSLSLVSWGLWLVSSRLVSHRKDCIQESSPTRMNGQLLTSLARALFLQLAILGSCLLILYLALYTHYLERPPLRTMGETRLLYSILLSFWGILLYYRSGHSPTLGASLIMSCGFLGLNIYHPESFDHTIMPALQSPWFIPHVVVYLLGYAILGLSALQATCGLLTKTYETQLANLIRMNQLVRTGYAFLCLGLIMGAVWAKEAWGHYWAWDPKETWALLTFIAYLGYLHLQNKTVIKPRTLFCYNILCFLILMLTWFGIRYLTFGDSSIHSYQG